MKNSKRKFNLILHCVLAIALTCAIIIGGILFVNSSVAWFAKNNNVSANGMAVNLKDLGIIDLYYIRYDNRDNVFKQQANENITFNSLMPGETVTIKAIYLSDEQDTHTLDIHFKDMGGGEDPLVKEGKYYYFGTQLKVTQKVVNGGTAEEVNEFLVTPPANKIFYGNKLNENELKQAENDLHLAEGLTAVAPADASLEDIGYNKEKNTITGYNKESTTLGEISLDGKIVRTLEFTVEFINYPDIDQNGYQGFGKGKEQCIRQLVAYVNS